MDKKAFRKKYSEKRLGLNEEAIEDLSMAIANRSISLPIWDHTYYHIFLPIVEKKEVNTEYLLHILQGRDKSVVLPKADFTTGEMQHILLQENTVFKVSEYNIPEPVDGIEIKPQLLDVVFVPLLAFDTQGNRIGYGKGFYDRFLSQCKPECIVIGLSFFEAEEKIIHEFIDFPLHQCITPSKTYHF